MFQEIKPNQLQDNPFQMIGSDWLLITASDGERTNSMTASWGGLGIMWGREVAYIFIRPQRFTKQLIDAQDQLSICVLPEEYRKTYQYLGSASGYNEDKIEKSGLTVLTDEAAPYFAESRAVMICKKLFAQPLTEDSFIEKQIVDAQYKAGDFHTMYVCEIEKVLIGE